MMKFYQCESCGKILVLLKDPGTPTVCCGKPMKELFANTTDAATEKHVPAVTVEGDKISVVVGSVLHPMTEKHYITMIVVETASGFQYKELKPTDEPKAEFLVNEPVVAVYEYCNLHGLWKTEVK